MSEFVVEPKPLDIPVSDSNSGNLKNVKGIKVGTGTNGFNVVFPEGVWLGAEKFADAPFSVDMEGNAIANALSLTGGTIKFGKTAYTDDTNSGYWLGNVTGTPKFNIGSSSTKYLHYDGTDFTLSGGTITGGTITGATVTAKTGTTGINISLDSSAGAAIFKYDNTAIGSIASDSTSSMLYSSNANHLFFRNGTTILTLNNNGITLGSGEDVNLQAGRAISWSTGTALTDKSSYIECAGDFVATKGIRGDAYSVKPSSTTYSGDTGTFHIVTTVGYDPKPPGVGNYYKYRDVYFRGGIITSIGSESGMQAW